MSDIKLIFKKKNKNKTVVRTPAVQEITVTKLFIAVVPEEGQYA
jgi:hypothetical protein